MNGRSDPGLTDYAFGPFRLSLPPGWTGVFEDGVHTITSDDHDAAIQISGFERETPVEMSDLYGLVPEGAEGLGRFTLPSGLDGFGWHDSGNEADMKVVRWGTAVLAISVVGSTGADEGIVDELIGSLAPVQETAA